MTEEHEEPDEREVVTEYGASLHYLPIQGSFRRTITKRYRAHSETYIKDIEVFAQADREKVAEHLEGNEVFAEAYLEAGNQAAHSADPEFREALARLIAPGLRFDGRVDEVAYWVTIMRRLEPAHLRYLKTVHSREGKPTRIPGIKSTGPYDHWKVARAAEMPVGVARSVADHLVHLGLLDAVGDGQHSYAPNTAGRALYMLCVEMDQGAGNEPASE